MRATPDLSVVTAAALQGEPDGFDRLVEAWLPVVVGWCARLGGPKVDPEDAAHDVFLTVRDRLDRVYSAERFPAWLFGVTRRTLARHRRRAFLRRWVPGLVVDGADPAPGPVRLYAVNETSVRVQALLERIPEVDREVLVLALLEDRPDTEVAAMLDVPLGTMKSRLRRARERFLKLAVAEGLTPSMGEVG
jgi:RNA polymerase sigma-70 factor (ECF subfamily)